VGGQQLCRDAAVGGYAIFDRMRALAPDLGVFNGDLVYADGDCPEAGRDGRRNVPGDFPNVLDVDWTDVPALREAFRRHWRYNRADPFVRRFLAATPVVSQWDDHEVANDFGAGWTYWNPSTVSRPGYPNLVREGRQAFLDWSPLAGERIYRSFRYGRALELFVLDQRSYRSRNDLPDTLENMKTMLGRRQIEWLVRSLQGSRAVWKVVSADVPISTPTGSVANGRDGWASGGEDTGFERELMAVLGALDAANVTNLVFVVTDVHFARNVRYAVDADLDGDTLVFHELVSGPLSAIRLPVAPLDPTTAPVELYAEGGIFNFGYARIRRGRDGRMHFLYDVRGEDGRPRPGSVLDLSPG
jgi:alkaline phosphatase D